MSSDRTRALKRDDAWAWIFIGPLMAGVAVFYFWPLLSTFYNSFTEFGAFGGTQWTGLENYRTLLTDGEVPRAVLNTLIYTAVVMLGIPLSVYLASLLNTPGPALRPWFYRVMFFMPIVAMPAAIADGLAHDLQQRLSGC